MKTLGGALFFLGLGLSASWAGGFITAQNADFVLGQLGFTTKAFATTAAGAAAPHGVAIDPASRKVFVAQTGLNAVYRYRSIDALASGAPAEAILGQPAFGVTKAGTTQSTMNGPQDVAVDKNGRLWVSDTENNRILRFDNAATKNSGAPADGILGQYGSYESGGKPSYQKSFPELFRRPMGLCFDSLGNLWVADYGDARVVRFNAADLTTDGGPGSLFLGVWNGYENRDPNDGFGPNQYNMGYAVDVFATPDGDIYVADMSYSRVLRYAGAVYLTAQPTESAIPAASVIGQRNFNLGIQGYSGIDDSCFSWVASIVVDAAGTLYAADYFWGRVGIFPRAASIAVAGEPTWILGKTDAHKDIAANPPKASSLNRPWGLALDSAGRLWVSDVRDNRVVRYSPGNMPTLKVTGKKRRRTTASSLPLRGRVQGERGTKAYVQLGKEGKVRTAKGKSKWSCKLALKPGKNVIRIYAMDPAGRKSKVVTIVAVRR